MLDDTPHCEANFAIFNTQGDVAAGISVKQVGVLEEDLFL